MYPSADRDAACTEPLRDSGEFVLRLRAAANRQPPHRTWRSGSSLIDRRAGGGVLITIDPRLVARSPRRRGAEPRHVLGRAIAHEIGHLLIGTPTPLRARADARALVAARSCAGTRPADWRFSADEAALMQQDPGSSACAAN